MIGSAQWRVQTGKVGRHSIHDFSAHLPNLPPYISSVQLNGICVVFFLLYAYEIPFNKPLTHTCTRTTHIRTFNAKCSMCKNISNEQKRKSYEKERKTAVAEEKISPLKHVECGLKKKFTHLCEFSPSFPSLWYAVFLPIYQLRQ